MTRRSSSQRIVAAVVAAFAATVLVYALTPHAAYAQDSGETSDYPGPFTSDSSDESTTADADSDSDTSSDSDTDADEVLGTTVTVPGTADGDLSTAFIAPDISPPAASTDTTTAAGGGSGGGLAATGSSVEPIIAISVGMLAVGGSALVSSRRSLRDLFR